MSMSIKPNTRIGYLVVLSKNDNGTYQCQCDCGNVVNISAKNLHKGQISCGCMIGGGKNNIIKERICRQCGAKFMGGPRAFYCPNCRDDRKKESYKKANKRRIQGKTLKIGEPMNCEICGVEIIRNSARQRFCKKCAAENLQKVDGAQSLKYYNDNKDKINAARYEKRRIKHDNS